MRSAAAWRAAGDIRDFFFFLRLPLRASRPAPIGLQPRHERRLGFGRLGHRCLRFRLCPRAGCGGQRRHLHPGRVQVPARRVRQRRVRRHRVRQLHAEHRRQVRIREDLPGRRRLLRQPRRGARAGEEVLLVHLPQPEEQLRLLVEARAHAVQHRRDVLAHRGPVRAAARERDLARRREQPGALRAQVLHHALRKAALQQLDERVDLARAAPADRAASAPAARASTCTTTV